MQTTPTTAQNSEPKTSCDIFCRVIDNYGDIGICWRLAHQLQTEFGWQIRLFVDEPHVLQSIAPDAGTSGVEVYFWGEDFPAISPANIVIEAFACNLPDHYIDAMAAQATKPVWINLEYLCVENWAQSFHAMPSPHPRLPLTKHFFFPGVMTGTGGLLKEKDLLARRKGFSVSAARARYPLPANALWVFLFCYENPALPFLLTAWENSPTPVNLLVAPGKPAQNVERYLRRPLLPGDTFTRGKLTLHALPFVPQSEFDEWLWTCDLNFVRGEDSFGRAQWAAKPFIWQIYPQNDAAHHAKLDAFYPNYTRNLSPSAQAALIGFSKVWNNQLKPSKKTVATAWGQLSAALPALTSHAARWQQALDTLGNLAENLAIFCKNR